MTVNGTSTPFSKSRHTSKLAFYWVCIQFALTSRRPNWYIKTVFPDLSGAFLHWLSVCSLSRKQWATLGETLFIRSKLTKKRLTESRSLFTG